MEETRVHNPLDGSTQITTPNGRFYTKRESRRKYWSITTVLDIVDKSDWLIPWALKKVKEALASGLSIDEALSAYRVENKRICDRGSRVHDWIEHRLKGGLNACEQDIEEGDDHFTQAFMTYFEEVYDIETISTEQRLFKDYYLCPTDLSIHEKPNQSYCDGECICEFIGYAGTYDWYGRINGKLTLIDWKTSGAIHDTYWMQLAAEVEAADFPVERVMVVRLKPETKSPRAQIIIKQVDELQPYWKSFLKRLITCHDVRKEDS